MNTSTATSTHFHPESVVRRIAKTILAGVYRAFERTGRACLNGSMPV